MLADDDAPPTEDPRDYAGTDALCACCHPEHFGAEPCDRPGCVCPEYAPHPDTPASIAEHLEAILDVIATTTGWPESAAARAAFKAAVAERLGRRFDAVTAAQALCRVWITDAQWAALSNMDGGLPADAGLRGRSAMGGLTRTMTALCDAGWVRWNGTDYGIELVGRLRVAAGRGGRRFRAWL